MTILNAKPYTAVRYTRVIKDGVIVSKESDEFTVVGNLQPVSSAELAQFPEGFRNSPGQKFTFYTSDDVTLVTGGMYEPDDTDNEPDEIIISETKRVSVHGIKDWSHGLIPHKRWICREVEVIGNE